MRKLNSDIKNGTFSQIYLLTGNEAFLKLSYKKRLKAAICGGDDINYAYFEGKDINEGEVIDNLETMPFFSERRLVVVENSGFFKTSHEKLANYLADMKKNGNTTGHIIFIEEETDKRNKLYKTVKNEGYICEMNHPEHENLVRWTAGVLAQSGKKITKSDMDFFLSRTGNDMERVKNEADKLISYLGDKEEVTAGDIEAITSETEVNRVFDMVKAITSRKQAEAMKLYEDLLALKEPPMKIIFLIAKQFNQLLQVKDLLSEGGNKDSIAAKLKLNPYIAGKLAAQVRSFERNMLIAYVKKCVDLEDAVKKGNMPERLAVEILICS